MNPASLADNMLSDCCTILLKMLAMHIMATYILLSVPGVGNYFFNIAVAFCRQTGFPAKWDRVYFFTKKGYLYIHTPPKVSKNARTKSEQCTVDKYAGSSPFTSVGLARAQFQADSKAVLYCVPHQQEQKDDSIKKKGKKFFLAPSATQPCMKS